MAARKQSQSDSTTKARAPKSRAFSSQPNSKRLRGQVAVVTGASRGIGLAIAGTLAAEGASVVITGRNEVALAEAAVQVESVHAPAPRPGDTVRVVPLLCDVRDLSSVKALFDTVAREFGRLDILVNNAGIAQPLVSIEDTSPELWKQVVDTNLTGLFFCVRAALPLMKPGSTIVNNLSAAAKRAFPNFAAYNSSKHGALGFTLSMREELMPRGIRVVALIPGAIDTGIWQQFWPEAPRARMMDVNSVAQAVLYAALLPGNANLSELVLDPTGGAL